MVQSAAPGLQHVAAEVLDEAVVVLLVEEVLERALGPASCQPIESMNWMMGELSEPMGL